MTDNKLKDNEIIKALESEIHLAEYVDSDYCSNVNLEIIKSALDFINRLQAELKVSNEALNNSIKLNNRLETQNKDLSETVHNLTLEKDALFDKAEELKAEIERLNALVKTKNKLIEGLDQSISYAYDRAIEEFANKVTHDINVYCENIRTKPSVDGVTGMNIANDLIYKRLKEMVGEDK